VSVESFSASQCASGVNNVFYLSRWWCLEGQTRMLLLWSVKSHNHVSAVRLTLNQTKRVLLYVICYHVAAYTMTACVLTRRRHYRVMCSEPWRFMRHWVMQRDCCLPTVIWQLDLPLPPTMSSQHWTTISCSFYASAIICTLHFATFSTANVSRVFVERNVYKLVSNFILGAPLSL